MIHLDSHVDTLHEFARLNIVDFDLSTERANLCVDVPKLTRGGVNALFLALFVKQIWGVDGGRARIDRLFGILHKVLRSTRGLVLTRTPDEITRAVETGYISVSLGIENGVVIGTDLGQIAAYHTMGVRYLTLCHNASNAICDSSTDAPVHGGLSRFGQDVIREMNRLGMMIDISHASDEAAEQVLALSARPIIASHSNARSVCDNPRNLSDRLLKRIAANGGVVQVSVLPKCVGGDCSVRAMVNHIDHIVRLVGTAHVGIGSDFDGGGRLVDCQHIGEMNAITAVLKAHGYGAADIEAIWGGNFMRVWRAQSD